MQFQNTLDFAQQMDANDPLKSFRQQFIIPSANEKEKTLIYNLLKNFIKEYPLKIKGMTVIEKLVELALPIEVIRSDSSGSQQTWLIRTAIDMLREYAKQTDNDYDIIQKICGRINHLTHLEKYSPSTEEIKAFAEGVYFLLYVKEWKKQMPIRNAQKDWIYQFGFVYKVRSDKYFKDKKAEKSAPLQ